LSSSCSHTLGKASERLFFAEAIGFGIIALNEGNHYAKQSHAEKLTA
jgi:hypothetical protein